MTYKGMVEITNDEYHSSIGYSKSALITYRDSPNKFYKEYILKQKELKESDDFLLGQLVHMLLLEFDKVEETYHLYAHINRSTKDGKAQAKELEEIEKSGKILVKTEIMQKALELVEAVRKNSIACSIIDGSEVEKSIYWQDESGITFKSRPDIIKDTIVADIKTCKDVSEKGFQRSCIDYGYYLQAAMAKLALESIQRQFVRFVFICVDKITHDVVVYVLDEQAIEYGLNQFKFLSGKLEQDLAENDWLKPRIKTLSVPRWAEWEQI